MKGRLRVGDCWCCIHVAWAVVEGGRAGNVIADERRRWNSSGDVNISSWYMSSERGRNEQDSIGLRLPRWCLRLPLLPQKMLGRCRLRRKGKPAMYIITEVIRPWRRSKWCANRELWRSRPGTRVQLLPLPLWSHLQEIVVILRLLVSILLLPGNHPRHLLLASLLQLERIALFLVPVPKDHLRASFGTLPRTWGAAVMRPRF